MSNPSEPKITIVRYQWPHHRRHSGYDNVFAYLEKAKNIRHVLLRNRRPSRIPFFYRIKLKLYSFFNQMHLWHIPSLERLKLYFQSLFLRNNVIHFTSFEDQSGFVPKKLKKQKNYLLATIHQPFENFIKNPIYKEKLKLFNGIILLNRQEIPNYKQIFDGDIFYIPHAVATHYFKPPADDSIIKSVNVLYIHGHLRKFEDFYNLVIKNNNAELVFHLVINQSQNNPISQMLEELNQLPQVHIYSNIPQERLLKLYQISQYVLLPFENLTASNTLLEAFSCGVIPVARYVAGLSNYDLSKIITYNEIEELLTLNLVDYCLGNPLKFSTQRKASREYAEDTFSLETISSKILSLYCELFQKLTDRFGQKNINHFQTTK